MATAFSIVGIGLLTRHWPGRAEAINWCLLMMFGFPWGTLMSAFFIAILVGKKRDFIYPKEYKEVVNKNTRIPFPRFTL